MQENEITDEYDKEFISLMLTIEKRSEQLNKYDKLRIKNWCKKLCQITNNIEWKKNRNLHAICILDSILNKHFEEPYNKFPPEGSVPILNKTLVKSKLSKKFFLETLNMERNEAMFDSQQKNMDNIKEDKEEYENENNSEKMKIINNQRQEINKLTEMIKQKDIDINNLIQEKNQMKSHIQELEQMINKFMNIEKPEQ